jgi:hypothetical protein
VRRGLAYAVTLGMLVPAAPAAAQEPRALTAPGYPGNTLTVTRDDPIVAGTVVRVQLSGHAEWDAPTDETTTPYDLYMYVQNPLVEPECAPWYGQQLTAGINIQHSASNSISGWVMESDLHVNPAPPATGIDWSGESVPFAVKPGLGDLVLLCAYQRYIIDDVASYQLPVRVEQPSCKAARSSVRRGRKLTLKCNVSGALTVRFRGPRSRTVKGRLSTKDGSGSVSTRSLKPGRYRVTAFSGETQLGRTFKVRVR